MTTRDPSSRGPRAPAGRAAATVAVPRADTDASPVALVLALATAPTLMFAAPLEGDDGDVIDLRATDLPMSDVTVRNEVRRRWRSVPRLVVRIDAEPSLRVQALLLELARREVRLTADEVDRFSPQHTVLVKTSASAPPASLVRLFPIRVRAPSVAATTPTSAAREPGQATGGSHARRR